MNLFERYLKGAKLGDNILVKATTEKVGRNLAFLNVQIVNKESGAVLAQGIYVAFFNENSHKPLN